MPSILTRECPQCHIVKPFRKDAKTCGCPKPPVEKVEDTTSAGGRVRVINVDATRICNEEQLIEALGIDLTKWYVDSFTVRKWEMGFVSAQHAETIRGDSVKKQSGKKGFKTTRTTHGESTTDKEYTPDHHQLFAVSCKLKRVVTEQDAESYVKDNVKLKKQVARVNFQLTSERRYNQQIIKQTAVGEELIAQIRDIAYRLGDFENVPFTKILSQQPAFKPAVGAKHSEDAVLLLSDTHFGDVIRPGDTSGFPEYDLVIAGNRFGYTLEKIRQILAIQRSAYPIKKLYIWFGGDMGNGDLHDAPVSNQLFIGPQVDFTFKMLKLGMDELITLTEPDENGIRIVEEIVFLFTCGNHMRESTCIYMPMKYQAQRTFDWLIYQTLIEWFSQERYKGKVSIKQDMSPYIFEEIRGHRHLFAHGMQVGYRNSPDAQCKSMSDFIDRVRGLFDSPEWRRKNGLQGSTFARACIGDIHVPVCFPRIISNGSLNGQNELGVNWNLEPIPCVQQLWGVTENHLQTFHYEVNCSSIQRESFDMNAHGIFAAEYERKWGRR
jgi:hypothetical protein